MAGVALARPTNTAMVRAPPEAVLLLGLLLQAVLRGALRSRWR